MGGRFDSLLASADDLRVEAFAQDPFCAEVAARSPAETFVMACERGFDLLPVRDEDGEIRRLVATNALEDAVTWQIAEHAMSALTADLLVARDAPAFSLLDRFGDRAVLFTLGRRGVDGVVTIYDLNQPSAYVLGFGLALISEGSVGEALRVRLGEDPDIAVERAEGVLGHKAMGVGLWKKAKRADKDVHLASKLSFGEKLRLLPRYGLADLADRYGFEQEDLLAELNSIKDLRNAIGHADTDGRLADPVWVYDRMRTANALARIFVETTPS